ncbi:MAG: 4-hydroxythreonine-4-phosphate dehydrogenase PdxA [Bacteroidales bacterium]|nr:4-hydroxythreonine-4-phosphate dehydrogenase PdxA [Bacteroidales bacterium]MCL2738016.1 4-hydroxythreonine-4-phosphate dehydrogenase PdxA [Bacteroidales bacterium]
MQQKITIGITQGDTNGVGYEVIIKALLDNRITEIFTPVIYGSSKFVAHYRKLIAEAEGFSVHVINNPAEAHPKRINLIQCVPDNFAIEPGKKTQDGAKAALSALQAAVADIKASKIQALVTAPFNKQNVSEGGFAFPGHTEFLANAFNATRYIMMLCSSSLRVGVATGHVPLAQISEKLSTALVVQKIEQLNDSLKNDFQMGKPKIAVLGLNPHAGDGGVLGSEEQQFIIPALEQVARQGILAFGPYAADGFFGSASFRRFDAVLAMYHDQGLIPFKTLAFHSGVNVTAGLPIIRTSPDHGTAYDIAGTGSASAESMLAALYMANDLYKSRIQYRELQKNMLKSTPLEGPQAG